MPSEVAKDFDDLYLDFIETNRLQLWPDYNGWTVQCPKPFTQVSHENLKGAITKMAFRLGDLRFKKGNHCDYCNHLEGDHVQGGCGFPDCDCTEFVEPKDPR